MGRRGPAPAPDAVKLARGETRPSRLNGREPTARAKPPRMPRDMSDRAKTEWRRVLREMADTGVIAGADAAVLRCYCEAVARYEDAAVAYAGSTALVRSRGGLVTNPLARIVRDSADQVRLFARELGLSPAARANLSLSIGPEVADIGAALEPRARLRVVGDHR